MSLGVTSGEMSIAGLHQDELSGRAAGRHSCYRPRSHMLCSSETGSGEALRGVSTAQAVLAEGSGESRAGAASGSANCKTSLATS